MNKKNLKSEMILNKKFSTELSGYSAEEVDKFLDLVLEDYRNYEIDINRLEEIARENQDLINDHAEELEALRIQNKNLNEQLGKVSTATAPELARRLAALEKEMQGR